MKIIALSNRYNEKEKEADFYNVLIMLHAGWSYTKMSNVLSRSRQYCCNIKMELVEEKLITQEEIDYASKSVRNKNAEEIDKIVYKNILSVKSLLIDKEELERIILSIKEAIEVLVKNDKSKEKETVDIKELKKATIKKLILANYSKTEICRETHYARTTVGRYIKELIRDGEIKESDVKNGKLEEMDMVAKRNELILALVEFNVPYDIIEAIFGVSSSTISLVEKQASTLTEEERRIIDEKIIALVEFDIPYKIISASLDVSINYIKALKRKKEGRTYKRSKVPTSVKEIDESINNTERKILKHLNAGYFYPYIRKKLNMQESELMDVVNDLKVRKYITQEIINAALNNRRAYYKEMIGKLYNDGLTQADIYRFLNSDNVEEISNAYISRFISKLDCEGLIDHDKITQIKEQSDTSNSSIDERVLALLIKGYTVKEMCEQDDTHILTESRVRRSKKRLIAEGKITEKDIMRYQRKRKKRIARKALKELDKEIWYYIENYGLSSIEIANYVDVFDNFVNKRIKVILDKKKISVEDFRKLKKQVREKNLGQKVVPYKEFIYFGEFTEAKSKFIKMYKGDVPTLKVNIRYFNAFKDYVSIDLPFKSCDVDIFSYVVLYTESLCNDENIALVIKSYLRIGEKELASITLNNYISLVPFSSSVNTFRLEMIKLIKDSDGKSKKMS